MPAQSTHIPLKPSQSPRLTGYQAYAKAGRRWGFTPQVEVEKLEHAGEDNKITAQAVTQDLAYTIPIKIGTPGVVKHLLVDTSSSQTWILLGEQKGEKSEDSNASGREARGVYDPTASSTAEKLTQSWSPPDVIHPASVIPTGLSASVNESGVLSASPPLKPQSSLPVDEKYVEIAHTAAKIKTIPPHGEVYKDKIVIGSIELEGQMFELATKERFESTLDPEVEGVLGLGLGDSYKVGDEKAGQVEVIPVLQKLMDSLEAPVFTVNLTPGGQGSFYTFGSIDKGITPNALKFTSLDESESGEDGWAFASTAWSLDGVVQRRSGTCAVADTGTTLMLLDSDMCEKIYSETRVKHSVFPSFILTVSRDFRQDSQLQVFQHPQRLCLPHQLNTPLRRFRCWFPAVHHRSHQFCPHHLRRRWTGDGIWIFPKEWRERKVRVWRRFFPQRLCRL
ncbi:acid protease [Meredithblackwellia eburnea MCA 4105]